VFGDDILGNNKLHKN